MNKKKQKSKDLKDRKIQLFKNFRSRKNILDFTNMIFENIMSSSFQEYLDSIEIQTIMSLLKIIDNPMQDISLVTVLRSNIGNITDNELVEIRLADKQDNFYNCMQKAQLSVRIVNLKEKNKKLFKPNRKMEKRPRIFITR